MSCFICFFFESHHISAQIYQITGINLNHKRYNLGLYDFILSNLLHMCHIQYKIKSTIIHNDISSIKIYIC